MTPVFKEPRRSDLWHPFKQVLHINDKKMNNLNCFSGNVKNCPMNKLLNNS